MSQRMINALWATAALALILGLLMGAGLSTALPNLGARNLAPQWGLPFGSDHLGRDLFARALQGLALSFWLGLMASAISVSIAIALALLAGWRPWADRAVGFITDMMLAVPHLMLLILLSFAFGGGGFAVVMAVAFSHWPRLARILRAEVLQLMALPYVEASRGFGRSGGFVLWHHILPHLWPQAMIGFLLTFPHAILHEAGLSFLGFGLEPSRPAIGVMLAEAMRHITSGRWWLALFPGMMLLLMVLLLEVFGQSLRRIFSPRLEQC